MHSGSIDSARLPGNGRLVVAYSGGPDSVCLLDLLRRSNLDRELVCIHIDHGLDAESSERAERAAAIAQSLGLSCRIMRVDVGPGRGPEAEARTARYAALKSAMAHDDALLTAHHADDQTETVLLRLLRGAGPAGLAGIPAVRPFGPGWLARPLLDWPRSRIDAWLKRYQLDFIRDPANEIMDFDRNFLRHDIMPRLRARWPGVDRSVRRSARLCRGAEEFTVRTVDNDLREAQTGGGSLALADLSDDSHHYRATVIRSWCILRGTEPPPGRQLDSFLTQVATARPDRTPELFWNRCALRAWRSHLWLDTDEPPELPWRLEWPADSPLALPNNSGTLRLSGSDGPALELTVCSGGEGESFQPAGDPHHRPCKRLLADAGVPPWQRPHWPRLWMDGSLVALGTRWLEASFAQLLEQRQQSLVWQAGARRLASAGLESRA